MNKKMKYSIIFISIAIILSATLIIKAFVSNKWKIIKSTGLMEFNFSRHYMCFTDTLNGYMAAEETVDPKSQTAVLYKTTDGGRSWSRLPICSNGRAMFLKRYQLGFYIRVSKLGRKDELYSYLLESDSIQLIQTFPFSFTNMIMKDGKLGFIKPGNYNDKEYNNVIFQTENGWISYKALYSMSNDFDFIGLIDSTLVGIEYLGESESFRTQLFFLNTETKGYSSEKLPEKISLYQMDGETIWLCGRENSRIYFYKKEKGHPVEKVCEFDAGERIAVRSFHVKGQKMFVAYYVPGFIASENLAKSSTNGGITWQDENIISALIVDPIAYLDIPGKDDFYIWLHDGLTNLQVPPHQINR